MVKLKPTRFGSSPNLPAPETVVPHSGSASTWPSYFPTLTKFELTHLIKDAGYLAPGDSALKASPSSIEGSGLLLDFSLITQNRKLIVFESLQSSERFINIRMDPHTEDLPQYIHIDQNEFLNRKHKKQKEEDIAICECKYNFTDPTSACGDRCLNVFTSTECTPGYCPCGIFCRNQRFQKCENAKTKLFKTEGRGWGLLADENIKAGQFVIEYCGEVISWKEAKRRSHAYEIQGLKDAFIICLNASESIDATRKGSLARFINHSCQPNCETRKWNVSGEVRVGIFAKQDIPIGTELAYDYNFEWFGGAKVRCLCGAAICSGFLGAKSRGFQEDTYLWEDDDERYSVDKIPLYDSAEDEAEPPSKVLKKSNSENSTDVTIKAEQLSESSSLNVQQSEFLGADKIKSELGSEESKMYAQETQQKNAMIPRIQSNHTEPGSTKKPKANKNKKLAQKQVDAKSAALLLSSKEAQEEILRNEEIKNEANAALDSLYNEIRPAIEEHERDTQDSVSTSVAEKWIEACCLKLKAEFDVYSSIVKNFACRTRGEAKASQVDNENEIKLLTG
ncbi:hypothetical protein L6164_006972 [Bauhinia variegata]|uniref:Uncharacterized protein n=1 Tax=Bauhinia variegata TaxID=167791 RepID=A0ACB9PW32_BAUVA|nr:hypothetical protein L6164_006972 [Bauhinia variegata]